MQMMSYKTPNPVPAMMASRVIGLLQGIVAEHGDLPVFLTFEWTAPLTESEIGGVQYMPEHDPKKGAYGDYFPERIDIS